MPKRKRIVGATQSEVNLTPMIDCTFQLILFFVLTAQMASQELAKVVLPEPVKSMAVAGEEGEINAMPNKITVNVVNKYGDDKEGRNSEISSKALRYQLGQAKIDPGDVEQLANVIKERTAELVKGGIKKKDILVEIRADMDIAFQDIEPVMRAAAEAGITKMSMTALTDPDHKVVVN